jgi:hypothetical protein
VARTPAASYAEGGSGAIDSNGRPCSCQQWRQENDRSAPSPTACPHRMPLGRGGRHAHGKRGHGTRSDLGNSASCAACRRRRVARFSGRSCRDRRRPRRWHMVFFTRPRSYCDTRDRRKSSGGSSFAGGGPPLKFRPAEE